MVLLVPDNLVLLTMSHKTGLKISCLYIGDYCSLSVLNQDPRQINWAFSLGFSLPRICGGGSHSLQKGNSVTFKIKTKSQVPGTDSAGF